MEPEHDDGDPLKALDRRIRAAREAKGSTRSRVGEKYRAASVAWRMVTDLVAGVLVGGALGWGLDGLFGTLPIFLIVFMLLGFVAGIRLVLKTPAEPEMRADDDESDRTDEGAGPR